MIYLTLFLEFLKIGLFSFGGAYGAIPLIQDTVFSNGWMDSAMFSNMVALSESTPGPIMVNAATYVGNCQAGILGAIAATLGVILPAFFIILLVVRFLKNALNNKYIQSIVNGIKPCLMGVILSTGLFMAVSTIVQNSHSVDYSGAIIFFVLLLFSILHKVLRKTEIQPIGIILLAAILGSILY